MMEVNYLAITVAAVVAFVAAGGYYAAIGKQLEKLSSAPTTMPPWLLVVEVVKHFVVAAVVGGLSAGIGITTWSTSVLLGFALWIGFPVILLLGSVVHEKVSWRLAALHAGDWLVKLLLIAIIVGIWK